MANIRKFAARSYVEIGDTRSPMLRLLAGAHADGYVEVNYDAQWRTLFKARRLGLLDDRSRLTEKGRAFVIAAH